MKKFPAKFCKLLAAPAVMSFSALWLIVLVVLGTLEQRSIGLYQAQERYFSSWFFMAWEKVPLPGAHLAMAVMAVGLFVKLVFYSKWKLRNWGINIIHLGAIILLGGGLVTSYFSNEGNMSIPEGGRKSYYEDSYRLEFALTRKLADGRKEVVVFPGEKIKTGHELVHPSLPFGITVKRFLRNVTAESRTEPTPGNTRGYARDFLLNEAALEADFEKNRAGLEIEVIGADVQADGIYQLMEYMPVEQYFKNSSGHSWRMELRRKRRHLPFEIELVDFKKEVYPGTARARSYQSEVKLIDGDIERRVLIHMNHPLRHRGYTLYQSSFIENGDDQTTVLAVVHNRGRLFPYVASFTICLGLLFHITVRSMRRKGS